MQGSLYEGDLPIAYVMIASQKNWASRSGSAQTIRPENCPANPDFIVGTGSAQGVAAIRRSSGILEITRPARPLSTRGTRNILTGILRPHPGAPILASRLLLVAFAAENAEASQRATQVFGAHADR